MKKIFFIFIAILLFLTACGGGGGTTSSNDSNNSASSKVYRIMPLGDSITYDDANAYYDSNGRNLVPEGKRTAYRSFLAYDLNEVGIKYDFVGSRRAGYDVEPKFDPDNEGHPGWTSFQIADHVYHYLEMNPADIVLLHIGTNDKYGGGGERVDGTERIINEIERFANDHHMKIHIFVALIINRWLWDRTIEKYNANLRAMLEARNDPNITIVDMSELISGGHHDYLENTHPNKQGYKKIADKWFIALTDYLLN